MGAGCQVPIVRKDPTGIVALPRRSQAVTAGAWQCLPAQRPRGRGQHCGPPAAAAAAAGTPQRGRRQRGGGGGADGAAEPSCGAVRPGHGGAVPCLRAPFLPPLLPPASPRPFLTSRGVDLGGFPLQGHPQRRVQAGPVRHAAAAAAGEARGRLRRRRDGHGPPQRRRCVAAAAAGTAAAWLRGRARS